MKTKLPTLIVDTREQSPLTFWPLNWESVQKSTLKTGDYSIKGFENKIAIERKSTTDLFGTIASKEGHARFRKELLRAKDFDKFYILIEDSLTTILDMAFEGAKFIKANPDTLMKSLHTIEQKYGANLIFCNGREEASKKVKYVLHSYYKLNHHKL